MKQREAVGQGKFPQRHVTLQV